MANLAQASNVLLTTKLAITATIAFKILFYSFCY